MHLSHKTSDIWRCSYSHRWVYPFLQPPAHPAENKTDTAGKAMSVCYLKFNIYYHLGCFCTLCTIWGSSHRRGCCYSFVGVPELKVLRLQKWTIWITKSAPTKKSFCSIHRSAVKRRNKEYPPKTKWDRRLSRGLCYTCDLISQLYNVGFFVEISDRHPYCTVFSGAQCSVSKRRAVQSRSHADSGAI